MINKLIKITFRLLALMFLSLSIYVTIFLIDIIKFMPNIQSDLWTPKISFFLNWFIITSILIIYFSISLGIRLIKMNIINFKVDNNEKNE